MSQWTGPRCRQLKGLKLVKSAENPWGKRRLSGVAAQGMAFERSVAKALPRALHGQWFYFEDDNGPGYCSPDFILVVGGVPWVLECKLTFTPEAYAQLNGLYLPLVSKVFDTTARGLVVVKGLGRAPPKAPFLTLAGAMAQSEIPLLLWPAGGVAHRRQALALPP